MSMLKWFDDRYPLTKVWNEHLAQYYAPKNFNSGTSWDHWHAGPGQPDFDWRLAGDDV